ncbi:MAG: ribonuclease E/G [Proteobacteria bacterium]|nr:ribonuclease E/G [Pseudomonadota bacterium]
MSEQDTRSPQPDTILIARSPGETRYALMADETVLAVVHRRDADVQPGAIYHGRVKAPVPGTGAVFVDYGEALPGVLYIKSPPPEGSAIGVTVTVPPRPGKGAELKAVKAAIASGAKLPLRAASAPEPVVDWMARYGASIRAIICQPLREVARVRALLDTDAVVESHPADADLFTAFGVDEAIEAALRPEVKLPSGGSIIVEYTRALTVIDVNSGGSDPARANYEAMAAVAAELRRRNVAGHILIDVIPTKARASLPRILTKALAADPNPAQVVGLTSLGLLEMTRQRMGLSLAEVLMDKSELSAASVAYRALRAVVRVAAKSGTPKWAVNLASDVAALLQGPLARAVNEAHELTKVEIQIVPHADFKRERIDISPAS